MIELSQQQCHDVKNGKPVRVASTDVGEDLVILTASQYELLQEELEDQREQKAVLAYSKKQAAKIAAENPY